MPSRASREGPFAHEVRHGKNQGLDDVGVRVIYALGARGR
jgi:hypothetical protein